MADVPMSDDVLEAHLADLLAEMSDDEISELADMADAEGVSE